MLTYCVKCGEEACGEHELVYHNTKHGSKARADDDSPSLDNPKLDISKDLWDYRIAPSIQVNDCCIRIHTDLIVTCSVHVGCEVPWAEVPCTLSNVTDMFLAPSVFSRCSEAERKG